MKLLKKNQIIIYVIAIMLMTAGYLNYTTKTAETAETSVETAMQMESTDDTALADIGDATLVSSNDVVGSNTTSVNEQAENQTQNTSSESASSNSNNLDSENTQQTSSSAGANSDEYFTKSKLERDTMYSQMIETYENILNSSNASETQKQSATEEIKKINDLKNSIMITENLLQTKGFENSVIFVNGESVSVIIGKDTLEQEEVAQIQNIVSREMQTEITNLHISNK